MTTFHAQDVAAAKQAEAEKLAAVKAAEEAKAKAVQMATESRTKSLQDENERMKIAMLDGVNKVQAQFEKTMADINAQIEAAETPEQKAILEERKVLVSEQRQRDLDALQPAENKLQAQFEKSIADINAQIESAETPELKAILEERKVLVSEKHQRDLDALQPGEKADEQRRVSLPGRADSMAAVGGFLGGERPGLLQVQQKQERLQQENNQALKNNAAAIQQLTTQVEQLSSAMTGGIV
jgi:hypothetical protein